MDSLVGKTIRWRFVDGPTAGTMFEHTFLPDGSVTWRTVNGSGPGHPAMASDCGVVRVSPKVHAASYLSDSGFTLTVVLNFDDMTVTSFASNDKHWFEQSGTFEVVS